MVLNIYPRLLQVEAIKVGVLRIFSPSFYLNMSQFISQLGYVKGWFITSLIYLQDLRAILEVCKGTHDFLINHLNGFLPVVVEPSHQCLHSFWKENENIHIQHLHIFTLCSSKFHFLEQYCPDL